MKEPNVYALCLDELMKKKRNKLRIKRYYIEADHKYMLTIGVRKAKRAWNIIYKNVTMGEEELGPTVCPFCVFFSTSRYNSDCTMCPYRKTHGECNGEDDNDYSKIPYSKKRLLTNIWYKKTMKDIKNKFLVEKTK
jgi:hypothetical protein